MTRCFFFFAFCCLTFTAIAQNHEAGPSYKVKTRCYVQAVYSHGAVARVDTQNCEIYNKAGKPVLFNTYKNNRISGSIISTIDPKGQTISMIDKTGDIITSRKEYFYDTKGHVIKTIEHNFEKGANGEPFETGADTNTQTFDKVGNRISIETRTNREKRAYDAHSRLIETDFYLQRTGGKPQKTVNLYVGDLLKETLYYWYDGRLYHRITNTYDDKNRLGSVRDSTTDWLQEKHFSYDAGGLKATEVSEKTSHNKLTKTTIEYAYDDQNRLLTQTFHSNDRLLPALYPLSYRLKQSDYELKDTFAYDQFGNRLQIISLLDDEKIRVIDFVMSYYK